MKPDRRAARSLGIAVIAVVGGMHVAAVAREDERVEELMERLHEGRRSPYRQIQVQAEADRPAWPIIVAAIPRFNAMAQALVESPVADIKDSSDGYVEAVKGLNAAARAGDPRALREAVTALGQSCGDCHYDGGVGGELEHEPERAGRRGERADERREEREEEERDEDDDDDA